MIYKLQDVEQKQPPAAIVVDGDTYHHTGRVAVATERHDGFYGLDLNAAEYRCGDFTVWATWDGTLIETRE